MIQRFDKVLLLSDPSRTGLVQTIDGHTAVIAFQGGFQTVSVDEVKVIEDKLSVDEVERVCQECAETMRDKNYRAIASGVLRKILGDEKETVT